jgi:hypothetical protein
MANDKIKSVLQFMQSMDRNGDWLNWYDEIQNGESTFDKKYVISVLTEWYEDSKETKYLKWREYVSSL